MRQMTRIKSYRYRNGTGTYLERARVRKIATGKMQDMACW
jgi:hypothetical protein